MNIIPKQNFWLVVDANVRRKMHYENVVPCIADGAFCIKITEADGRILDFTVKYGIKRI